MFDRIDLINYSIVVAGITISIIGLLLAIRIQLIDRWTKRFFVTFFSVLTLYVFSNLFSQLSLVMLGEDYSTLSKASLFLESLFSSILMPLLTIYMLKLSGQPLRCLFFYLVSILWIIYAVLLIITQFTTFIYQITDDNVYKRGPYYPVLLVPPVLLMLLNLIGLIRRRKLLKTKEKVALSLYLLLPMLSMIVQMTSYGILMIVLGTSVSALIFFLYIMNSQIEESLNQAEKIADQSIKIRTLQMRPHFIYNTMSNIYYLCDLDPKKAQKVVGDFTNYLRKNFSAIEKNNLIPFETELEHTKAFLAVVEARYENMISVEYDTDYTAFRLPPLTVEPIVENAVKHGLDPETAPLYIWIRTRETATGSEIIIENTGLEQESRETGELLFTIDDTEPHLGLENTKERLRALCGGTISFSNREGGGVVVKIYIPQKQTA